jgi:hypothetical protein
MKRIQAACFKFSIFGSGMSDQERGNGGVTSVCGAAGSFKKIS